ncbi:hypothetical protein GYMLUDRAFT_240999 [Collybiopsis luxurians FD-317 M1]|nr:hypothetical protein GYMLUDRAFT_240999 [Collybiopsis luxurians FD-317 M1]
MAGGGFDEEGEGSYSVEYEVGEGLRECRDCIGGLFEVCRGGFFVLTVKPDKMFLDRLLGKEWRLLYLSAIASVPTDESSEPVTQVNLDIMQNPQEDSTVALPGVPVDDWIANETASPIVGEKKLAGTYDYKASLPVFIMFSAK